MLIFERLAHQKNRDFLTQTTSPTRQRFQKKNCAHTQSFFELPIPIPIPIPIPSKFSKKRMTHSPIPIPSGLKGITTAASDYPGVLQPGVFQLVHVKVVTKVLFQQCTFRRKPSTTFQQRIELPAKLLDYLIDPQSRVLNYFLQ